MASLTRRAGGPGPLSRPCVVDQGRCRLLGTDAKSWTVFFFVICPKRVNRPPHRAPKFLHLDFTSYGLQQIYYGSRCCWAFSPPGQQAVRASKRPYCECPGLHPPGTSPCRTGFMASRTQGASILLSDVRARDALASDIACDSLRGQQKKRAHPLPGSLDRGGGGCPASCIASQRQSGAMQRVFDGWVDGWMDDNRHRGPSRHQSPPHVAEHAAGDDSKPSLRQRALLPSLPTPVFPTQHGEFRTVRVVCAAVGKDCGGAVNVNADWTSMESGGDNGSRRAGRTRSVMGPLER